MAGAADFDTADFFRGFAGRLLPNDPLNIFPFLVFLSPLPMIVFLRALALYKIIKVTKSPDTCTYMPGNGASLFGGADKNYNFADSSLPALNLATFLALILITAPV